MFAWIPPVTSATVYCYYDRVYYAVLKLNPNRHNHFLLLLSAIQAIENYKGNATNDKDEITLTYDRIMSLHGITITIQWIPCHSVPGHSDIFCEWQGQQRWVPICHRKTLTHHNYDTVKSWQNKTSWRSGTPTRHQRQGMTLVLTPA